ncbi:alpha/beta fold hydrolase [Pendulispora albinea]|uniref:Alpha/beta hydrolase n=1 Tax=Pendulispora albinea TaxID=2741071 RepID=A0ABZ2LYL5_9BACT
MKIGTIGGIALSTALGCGAPAAGSPAASADPGIAETTVRVGAQEVRYLHAGSDPTTVVLIHGWPESSRAWRHVMPRLARRYRVIAPDLRGIGGTSAPAPEYAKAALARDVHELVATLGAQRVFVIGHDIGGIVAYAYARLYPAEVKGVAILDIPVPGTKPWDDVSASPHAWHYRFHDQKPLAEKLVMGRQFTYFRSFIDAHAVHPEAMSDPDVEAYAAAYGSPASLTAGFELYRAFGDDTVFGRSHAEPLEIPILLAGADHSVASLEPAQAEALRQLGARNVQIATIPDSGHYVAEENPAATADAIETFIRGVP